VTSTVWQIEAGVLAGRRPLVLLAQLIAKVCEFATELGLAAG
jgi:hypothetical protein